jgi:hypothetical protein
MRRTLFTVLLVAAVVVGIPSTAQARSDDPLNRSISGVVSGTVTRHVDLSCFFPTVQHFDLTIHTVQGPDASLSIDVCIVHVSFIPPDTFARFGGGTFVLTLASGATLTGDVTASELGSGNPQQNSFDFALTAKSGTRELQHATGTLLLSGTSGPLANVTGTLTSNLTGSIPGNIFETTFKRCNTLHVGYNRFTDGTVVRWTVSTNGVGQVASGQFTAIGGGKLGSKTYHFLNIPLGVTLPSDATGIQSHMHFYWGTSGRYVATRDPGC